MKRLSVLFVSMALLAIVGTVWGDAIKPVKPTAKDKCPVCGMFVAKYPDFAAQLHLKDGKVFHFDGTKDLFKFYHNIGKYAPGKSTNDVGVVFVTSYYDLIYVDGKSAWYVVGSNIYGPMGREVIPFSRESEAKDFSKDHDGKKIVRFKDVTPAIIKGLD